MVVTVDLTRGIPVEEVPDHFPRNRGKKIGSATAWRYVLNGILDPNGDRVKLASFKAGGRRYVLPEAIAEFIAAINGEADQQPKAPDNARRAREAARALEKIGC